MDSSVQRPAQALDDLARDLRGATGSLRAAAETLDQVAPHENASRARLLAVVAEESLRLGELVDRLERLARSVAAADLPAGARDAITVVELMAHLAADAASLGYETVEAAPLDAALGARSLAVPGGLALAAVSAFLGELRREMAVSWLRFGARQADRHLLLDLGWHPEAADLPRLLDWPAAVLDAPGGRGPGEPDHSAPRGLRSLARDYDGEAWFIVDRDGTTAHVKALLLLDPEEER